MTSELPDEIPVGLYLLRRIRELGCKTVQGLPGTFFPPRRRTEIDL